MALTTAIGIEGAALAPFAVALLAPAACRLGGGVAGWLLALVPAAIFVFLASLLAPIASGGTFSATLAWAPAGSIDFSLRLDGLSLVFGLAISGIGTLILIYSGAYLRGHPHQGRFLAFLLAFMGAMLGLVLADSLVALYGFWELTAVTSFLLIGFDHTRQAARRAAVQAFLMTNIGGLALLFAAVMLQQFTGSWDLSAMVGQGAQLRASPAYGIILAAICLAAFTKSAQFPLHFWLPNAMEAPTPVSAYLHSATMVQAGVYLLARTTPLLGGTSAWTVTLTLVGGVTLAFGSVVALMQTDIKQMLAYSTVASLGLLVLLLGMGGEIAITAAVIYFIVHALYKAGYFLVAGLIDQQTGLRDITALGGLREPMAASLIAAILAAFGMLGLPPALGYLAKEEIYAALGPLQWAEILVPLALVGGNAALGAVGLALLVKPFAGPLMPTPKPPGEGPLAMLVGPLLLGILGIGMAVLIWFTTANLIAPAASAIAGHGVAAHVDFTLSPADPAIWLSLATWSLTGVLFWKLDTVRTVLRRSDPLFGGLFNRCFDAVTVGLVLLAGTFSRSWQHGILRRYVAVVCGAAMLALLLPLWLLGGLPPVPRLPALLPVEWAVLALAVGGLVIVVAVRTLLVAILTLGLQGLAVALIYLLFGAPDLGFTQFMVETLSIAMFALVMARLRLGRHEPRPLSVALRDAVLAVLCGGAVSAALLAVVSGPLDLRLSRFFEANAEAVAHGRNVVNVILVDFRGLDTFGEVSVLMTAGIAIIGLIASGRSRPAPKREPEPSPRRRRAAARGRRGAANESAPLGPTQ